ncbi:Lrp/AsnC family transcriptional regulator [Lysinibacter cavernae]|uniref:DNA-binding Lrp family transcriptional regulator n=1 Tax=Lysinibacter cavernae TaxID=1640652 RepID=A0A7X5TTP4_9MICO|nr:Lrp/AsnC family transcriptional regulator [Lysinibacter cavernae]NIH54846.1 DNA-binding Lrp family transcriptional regulator [Lysinibacter cavernae]
MKIDSTNIAMIDLLRRQGRISIAAISEQLGISRSNAYARYEWLVSSGVITSFHARINPEKVGLNISALVFVTLEQALWTEFREQLATVEELEYFAVTTGQHDAMLTIRATSVAAIHELVSLRLAKWPSIKATETVFLMDEQTKYVTLPSDPYVDEDDLLGGDAGQRYGMTRFIRTKDESMAQYAGGDATAE